MAPLIRYLFPRALLDAAKLLQNKPVCYTKASKYSQWRTAMNAEFNATFSNSTWTLITPKPHFNFIGCKWVYHIVKRVDGIVERYKAKLVAKGFHQQQGLDFIETFSLVIKPSIVRMVLTTVFSGWPMHQFDVQNAFLHGSLLDVFILQPPGYHHPQFPHHVYHLCHSLYGLYQAPREWFSRLTDKLVTYGFTGSKSDIFLFIYRREPVIIFLLIYVDNLIITGSSIASITYVLKFNINYDLQFIKRLVILSIKKKVERDIEKSQKGVSLEKTLNKISFISFFFFLLMFVLINQLPHPILFFPTSSIRAQVWLFNMANSNLPLQCPRLTKDNYQTWCIRVKACLGSQDVWETIEKGFEQLIDRVTLTSAQMEAVQKARRKDQLTLTIIHQHLDDTTFEIVANVTTAKQS